MRDLRLRDVRKHFGVVQQNTELFGGSIEENIGGLGYICQCLIRFFSTKYE